MDHVGFYDAEEGARHARARRAFEERQREMLAAYRREKGLPQPVGVDSFEAQPLATEGFGDFAETAGDVLAEAGIGHGKAGDERGQGEFKHQSAGRRLLQNLKLVVVHLGASFGCLKAGTSADSRKARSPEGGKK